MKKIQFVGGKYVRVAGRHSFERGGTTREETGPAPPAQSGRVPVSPQVSAVQACYTIADTITCRKLYTFGPRFSFNIISTSNSKLNSAELAFPGIGNSAELGIFHDDCAFWFLFGGRNMNIAVVVPYL